MGENNIKEILKASYKPQVEAEQDFERLGYKYDPELSSMDSKVFYDPKTNKPHIAYRGSVRVIDDWLDNIKLGLGYKSKSVEESVGLAKQVQDKYGQAPDTYGHSRGGLKLKRLVKQLEEKLILIIKLLYQLIFLKLFDLSKLT